MKVALGLSIVLPYTRTNVDVIGIRNYSGKLHVELHFWYKSQNNKGNKNCSGNATRSAKGKLAEISTGKAQSHFTTEGPFKNYVENTLPFLSQSIEQRNPL